MRIHIGDKEKNTFAWDLFEKDMLSEAFVTKVQIYKRTGDVALGFTCQRREMLRYLSRYEMPKGATHQEKDASGGKVLRRLLWHYGKKVLLPAPLRSAFCGVKGGRALYRAAKSRDALAVGVLACAGIQKNLSAAEDAVFVCETLRGLKKPGRTGRVRVCTEKGVQVRDPENVLPGEEILVRSGERILFDGIIKDGRGLVNESLFTGKETRTEKGSGIWVYAGTVLETGAITVTVRHPYNASGYDAIAWMAQDRETSFLAEKRRFFWKGLALCRVCLPAPLLPCVACGMGVWEMLRPKEARTLSVGKKERNAVLEADTVVLNNKGTLSESPGELLETVSFNGDKEEALLQAAACVEKHHPHAAADRLVREAEKRNLSFEAGNAVVKNMSPNGMTAEVQDKRVAVGSRRYIFEKEGAHIRAHEEEKFMRLPSSGTRLYMAIDGKLAAVFVFREVLKADARQKIQMLKNVGFKRVILMTGDGRKTAERTAEKAGIRECVAEALPARKAACIRALKEAGHKVVAIGDSVYDIPALREADAGFMAKGQNAPLEMVLDIRRQRQKKKR